MRRLQPDIHRYLVIAALAGTLGGCGSIEPAELCEGEDCATATAEVTGGPAYLGQGWGAAQRKAFHRSPNGGLYVPLAWYMALETPTGQLVASEANYRELGIVPDPTNPAGLAVGTISTPSPIGEFMTATCALCHTNEIRYRGTRMRLDGTAGMLDVRAWLGQVFGGLVVTANDPQRFDRFSRRILGNQPDAQAVAGLKAALDQFATPIAGELKAVVDYNLLPLAEGPGRLDAFGANINFFFGKLHPTNVGVMDAPVSVPSIWGTSDFDWSHYGGIMSQRIARNVLQAVAADLTFTMAKPDRFASNMDVLAVHENDALVATLGAPRWPEGIMGFIDRPSAARGKSLFQANLDGKGSCASCHVPKREGQVLHLAQPPIEQIGTDTAYLDNLLGRNLNLESVGLGIKTVAEAYQAMTEGVLTNRYDALGLDAATRAELGDGRSNLWRLRRSYKAIPLAGIWATAPYLHNGSVPSLYELLLPPAQRSKSFYVGGRRDYDPVQVGYAATPRSGFLVDTTRPGNLNIGHEYGTLLNHKQRLDLVEYLKTL